MTNFKCALTLVTVNLLRCHIIRMMYLLSNYFYLAWINAYPHQARALSRGTQCLGTLTKLRLPQIWKPPVLTNVQIEETDIESTVEEK